MFNNNNNTNGGETRKGALSVLLAVFVVANVVTGVTLAATGTTFISVYSSEFQSEPTQMTSSGAATYDATNNRIVVSASGSSSNGRWAYTEGLSGEFRAEYNMTMNGGNINMLYGADDAASPSTGYYVTMKSGDSIVLNDASGTSLKSSSFTFNNGESYHVETVLENNTLTVMIDGATVLTHEFSNPDASGSVWAVRGFTSSSGDNYVSSLTLYDTDSDGDGISDDDDEYPFNAPKTFTHSSVDNETVDKAYLEASNGSLDVSLYGVNSTSGERIKLSETHADVGSETTLVTLDAVSGYDEYDLEVHGNASVESHGLLYESNAFGGGVSSETFNDGISSVLGGISSAFTGLRTGQMALGGLILVVGAILFIREGGD
ncbi:hypothetical protein [Halorussus sp. MSC15.2]|uniref:hypothetical protein n=1 Tax=Halorussus sp. MSC15.2 TaxID=2283638 RepID=UPI0013D2AB20|nr:hypothetical protein [Halorussus sp. MSC15.2]NEU56263.1 hypothetical protein [Halorussus sp. MSC15.2]